MYYRFVMPHYIEPDVKKRRTNSKLTQRFYALKQVSIAADFITNCAEISFDVTVSILYTLGVYLIMVSHLALSGVSRGNYSKAASSVHSPSKRLLQTSILLPITTEVISSKRDCMLLNLLINVTTTI